MQIKGYKAFEKGLMGYNNFKYEIGKSYSLEGDIVYNGNGFWFCKNVEDTFRFIKASGKEIEVCEVIGSGDIRVFYNEYYGYETIGCTNIYIKRFVPREEIYEMLKEKIICSGNYESIERFIRDYNWSKEELSQIKNIIKSAEIADMLAYYEGDKEIYRRRENERNNYKRS